MKKKILLLLCSFAAIYLINFIIPRLMPGDPFDYQGSDMGLETSADMSREMKDYLRTYYGMDKPLGEQLVDTISKNLRGDLGYSIHYKHPVAEILKQRLPWTLFIMTSTLVLSLLLGVSLALICVRKKRADKAVFSVLSVAAEIPPFLIGIMLLFCIAAKVRWIPISGAVTAFGKYRTEWEWIRDVLVHGLLPIGALTIVTTPRFFFTARAGFLSILEKPYMVSAKSRGLKEARIRWRYIFVNALPPIVARFFLSAASVIGGTLLIENVFAYPGLGLVMREAVKFRDYPMIQGVFLLSTILVLTSLFLSDVINSVSDRLQG